MTYEKIKSNLINTFGAEESTMMGTPCIRYKGHFFAMEFNRENALVIKLPAERVTALIKEGTGKEFNFTKKKFKEWVLIPQKHVEQYESLMLESLNYIRRKNE